MIKLFLLTIFQAMILSYAVAQNQEQSTCTSINGRIGRCIIIRQCPELLNILQTRPLKSETIDLLRQLQCGFDGNNPTVCCPIQNANIDTTYRDNNENDIKSNQSFKEENEQNTDKNIDDENLQYDFSNNSLIPTDCGNDLSQRIIGGEITELDEFPWMVLLEHAKPNGKVIICGGVLISRRYVLTAAHCIKGKDLPITWRLESVRLGEYNTDTNPDCVQDDENTLLCADEPISIGVEEQMAHENYRPRSRDQKYDIALLRLSRDVTFTNYIKPICLPSTASLGQKLFVAGWGKTENGSSSNVKLKVSLPFVNKQQCQLTYDNVQVSLGYGQICVGGQKGKDSCRGDSGGPLMTVERERNGNGRWIVAGIVSFGPLPCGMFGWPGVYTRTIDFIPWILSKMKP